VPPAVVIVRSTVPAEPAGEVAEIELSLFTVKLAALVAPKLTAVAPVKFEPVIVTTSPPAVTPIAGLTALIAGGAM
jgi:hypothetical protein